MDSTSAARLARSLGTNTPRVLRGIDRLGILPARGARGALALTGAEVARLTAELGVEVRIPELRRTQVLALAALARAPLGLRSARALSRRSGLSPTAASAVLGELVALGLAETREVTVAEGRARRVAVTCADHRHPRWPGLAPQLAAVELPEARRERPRRVPVRLAHVFWNAPVRDLDPAVHGCYLARRVLRDGDTQALAWAAESLTASDWLAAAGARGLDPRQRALARNLAAAAR